MNAQYPSVIILDEETVIKMFQRQFLTSSRHHPLMRGKRQKHHPGGKGEDGVLGSKAGKAVSSKLPCVTQCVCPRQPSFQALSPTLRHVLSECPLGVICKLRNGGIRSNLSHKNSHLGCEFLLLTGNISERNGVSADELCSVRT